MEFKNTLAFAQQLDAEDPLSGYREAFHFPKVDGKQVIYFTGNSLGLQPKNAQKFVDDIMTDWREMAVEGHFYAKNLGGTIMNAWQRPWPGLLGQSQKRSLS